MGTRGPMYGGMGGLAAGGGADPAPVTAPAATSEAVAADGAPAGKTFGAFTDPDGRIASYSAAITNAVGSTAIASGSGLGAYTVSGYANGDSYVLRLTALDASGDPLATAVHVVDIAPTEYPALVPPSPPAAQALASGSTSSSAISWGSPTGGSGSTTTADVLTQDVGTGASLSAGAVVGLEDGDVVRVRRTWTDSVTGQTVSATTTVSVAAAVAGAGWSTLADIDFTAADTLAGINSGTLAVTTDSGATSLCSIVVDPDSSAAHTVGVTTGVGVVCDGPQSAGRVTAAIDIDALLGGVSAADVLGGVYCVQMVCSGIVNTASGSSLRWAVGEVTDANSTGVADGLRLARTTASTATWQTLTSSVTETWGSAVTTPITTVITLYLIAGANVAGRFDDGTTTPPSPSLVDITGGTARRVAVNAAAAGTGMRYDGSSLYAMASPGGIAEVVIGRLIVSRYG